MTIPTARRLCPPPTQLGIALTCACLLAGLLVLLDANPTVQAQGITADAPLGPTRALRLASGQTVLVNGREAVAGDILVRFRDGRVSGARRAQLEAAAGAEQSESVGRNGLRRLRSRRARAAQMLAALRAQADVEYAEPNYILTVDVTTNDAYMPSLWGMSNVGQVVAGQQGLVGADIDASVAWDVSTGNRAVVVGVIDTGIDYNHPDLAANIWSAPAAFSVTVGGVTITCAAGTHGFNAITRTCDPMDDNNHGTHVAGTIGAVGHNGAGVVGVNWTTSMMALKFLNASGSGTTANAINAIDFAVQAKAAFSGSGGANVRVLSNSWGGGGYSQSLADAIARANNADMLFVAAAGNSNSNNDIVANYPAGYATANVVAVAATDNRDNRASFSSYGRNTVHLGAPGVGIMSTVRNNSYASFNGTSMATPQVSGAAALVLSTCALNTAALKHTLLNTVDLVPSMSAATITGGRLNVNSAIRSCFASSPVRSISLSGDLTFGSTPVGSAALKTLRIQNTGNSPLTVSSIAVPAGFSAGNWSGTIGAGASTLVNVTFQPMSPGNWGGTITVNANHTAGTNTIPVSGLGVCSYQLSAADGIIRAQGGTLSLAVSTANACSWSASTTDSWIHTTSSASGAGTISFTVDVNLGATRVGTLSVSGATYTLVQTGPALPSVSTAPLSAVTSTTATGGGTVAADGGAPVTARGVVFSSTNPNPTLADSVAAGGTGTGAFTTALGGLSPNTRYYVRAYATNAVGTAYGDVTPDILWRNAVSGQNVVWRMNGFTREDTEWLESVPDTNWAIAGSADFNADGMADILWRNRSNGQVVVWYMNGTSRTSTGWLDTVDLNWTLVGAADFNADGHPDLLWRHLVNGENVVWLMSGLARSSTITLPTVVDQSWAIAGVGDFDSDGRPDLVWRHGASGHNVVWLMNGTTLVASVRLDTVPDLSWRIIGTGAFDGDGRTDILWRNQVNGQSVAWDLDGTMRLTTNWFETVPDLNWRMAGAIKLRGTSRAFTTTAALPAVMTSGVGSITSTSSAVSAQVTSSGGVPILGRGVCRSTSANPTTSDICVSNGMSVGAYSVMLSGLWPSTVYHVRAFVTTSAGTAYGADLAFVTSAPVVASPSSVTPPSGSTTGGMSVTVRGTNFAAGATVNFGGSVVAAQFVSATALTVILPAHAEGVVNVTVLNPGAAGGTLVNGFTYAASTNTSDFNRDGKPDLLWRSEVTGQNQVWHLDGATMLARTMLPAVPDLRWQMIGTGDFNRDGEADILWRNGVTGENVVWLMNGAMRVDTGWLPAVPDLTWRLVSAADFNGDEMPDILWRNTVTGGNVIWYMNGLVRTATAFLDTVPDLSWQMVGTGDFNGDGRPDILWRNTVSGDNVVWFMNDGRRSDTGWLPTVADLRWSMAAADDFDGDGKVDIVWRNRATGENVIWFLDGLTHRQTGWLPTVTDLTWIIVGR